MTLTAVTVFASLAWLINISAIVVDLVPKHSLGTVFSVVAAGSTIGGIVMNMIVAAMVSGPSTKPAGFLDQGFKYRLRTADQRPGQGLRPMVPRHGLPPSARPAVALARRHPSPHSLLESLRKNQAYLCPKRPS